MNAVRHVLGGSTRAFVLDLPLEFFASEVAVEDELNTARRYLADIFAVRIETVGSVADMVVALRVLGLSDDYYDTYRKEIGTVTGESAQKAIAEHVREGHAVIAVSGGAD